MAFPEAYRPSVVSPTIVIVVTIIFLTPTAVCLRVEMLTLTPRLGISRLTHLYHHLMAPKGIRREVIIEEIIEEIEIEIGIEIGIGILSVEILRCLRLEWD